MKNGKETETQRRARHAESLRKALVANPDVTGGGPWSLVLEATVRATTYAAVPGKQKRNASYMTSLRETVMKAACRAARRGVRRG